MAQELSISTRQLWELIKNNNVVILDVRSKEEFELGSIFGAQNISVDELSDRHKEVSSDKLIVTYCGKGGGRSERAANLLKASGKQAVWLIGGFSGWTNDLINASSHGSMIFHQLFEKESSSYTYLLADSTTREAILIDPVFETVERDLKLLKDLDLHLLYVLDTHIHADHVTGSGEIKKKTAAKYAVSKKAGVCCADIELVENQEIKFGKHSLKVLETPGHTSESLSFLVEGMVFTGDSLMIGGSGRTDFQNGSSDSLYDSIHRKLFTLDDETKVFPAHDYKGILFSTIAVEKRLNPRVGGNRTKLEFIKIMDELKLPAPKKIHIAVPANMACGEIIREIKS